MIEELAEEGKEDLAKRINLFDQDIRIKEIHDFVSKKTKKFFDTLNISADFLEKDPACFVVWSAIIH